MFLSLIKACQTHTLLTPNRRLAAVLHQHYQNHQQTHQHAAWEKPDILSITAWIEQLWQAYVLCDDHLPVLLNPAQEQAVWENILSTSKEHGLLFKASALVETVQTAWKTLQQWQISLDHPALSTSENDAALQLWGLAFQEFCKNNHWIDAASLPALIITAIQTKQLTLKKPILLIGFSEIYPQLQTLLAAIEKAGIEVLKKDFTQSSSSVCRRIVLSDPIEEMYAMARFAHAHHQANPQQKIGCIMPHLARTRDRVVQIFNEVFAPTHTSAKPVSGFNVSAGKALIAYPVIRAALSLLTLYKETLPLETMSTILLTPFLGAAETEKIKRAQFEALLRRKNITRVSLFELLDTTSYLSLQKHCPLLSQLLQKFFTSLQSITPQASYSTWVNLFQDLLSALGWPGERSLNSEEYQTIENWKNTLQTLTTLDYVNPSITLWQAWQSLHQLSSQTLFQAQSPEAPVQVLGLLEAAGLPFDHLWVAGMDDLTWPPPARPNPLIPRSLQREHHMPHATAEREFIFCKTLTHQFKQSAKTVIFSHYRLHEESELQASPLIQDLEEISLNDLGLPFFQPPTERLFARAQIESIIDLAGPLLPEKASIRGGIRVIKNQSACPFKAFAENRLHAHPIDTVLPGLRAKEKGQLAHKALELIWNTLKDQATLLALSTTLLDDLISASIEEAAALPSLFHQQNKLHLALEKQRLKKLLSQWLLLEKERPPFTIWQNEWSKEISLQGLTLQVRMDRIDQLADGQQLMIDYKTGQTHDTAHWFGERPDDPQLPLYALIDPKNTAGISFAQIHSGKMMFKGISREALNISGIKSVAEEKKTEARSWEEQQIQWQTTLNRLSRDFQEGKADVDPKQAETCLWCALKPLCRINENKTDY